MVRAVYGQNAAQSAAANEFSRTDYRREVAHGEGRPELAARVLGGLDHCPRVFDGRRDGLLAEHVHAALESGDHILCVVLVLGADDDGVDLLREGGRTIEEAHAELLGGLGAAICVFVGYAYEIRGGEIT